MHYYQFNIGDYMSHTRNLSLLEDLAYRRLLDEYYLHEQALNSGITGVARQIGMREHEDIVQYILESFFMLKEDGSGWTNARCDREIEQYRARLSNASKAGRASAERRLNASPTPVQLNKKHKPIINIKAKVSTTVPKPDGLSEKVWESFVEARKAKKAPITELVIADIKKQAALAGWTLDAALTETVIRGWRSFKAEWVTKAAPVTGNRLAGAI
jgi:uncharacterized protein YdaU (DUF1376 family)